MKFRKKPVVIEAMQWTGDMADWHALYDFCKGADGISNLTGPHSETRCSITTREGTMFAEQGDWIIRGIKGEFYPCKPDIFEATYERVDADDVAINIVSAP